MPYHSMQTRKTLVVVVLGEQLARLGKQPRDDKSENHEHNRPNPLPPTRLLLMCTHD